ncbi:MAG: zf-HC2 domain-containing protein [Rectinemataceae bacterium]|jgi:anti-sigma factor RsiW
MCPDRDLISAYVDGEVPSPWRERLEEHLGSCAACAALRSGYARLGERLRVELVGDEAESLARGRSRLDFLLEGLSAPVQDPWKARRRIVSLPLPLAAAAAVLVLLLCAATTFLALKPSRSAAIRTVASGEFAPLPQEAKAQSASMEELLRYLDARDGQVTLTIKLPSGTTFGSPGKPVIMRSGRVVRGPAIGAPVGGRLP